MSVSWVTETDYTGSYPLNHELVLSDFPPKNGPDFAGSGVQTQRSRYCGQIGVLNKSSHIYFYPHVCGLNLPPSGLCIPKNSSHPVSVRASRLSSGPWGSCSPLPSGQRQKVGAADEEAMEILPDLNLTTLSKRKKRRCAQLHLSFR